VNAKLSILIIDTQSAFHWIEIQGYVGEIRDEADGACAHINKLSEMYTGTRSIGIWSERHRPSGVYRRSHEN